MGAGGFIARRIGLFLLAIAVFSGFVSSVQANTLYVGDGGYQTIQDAIDAAGPGDTVVVGPGTYLENVTLWDSKEGIRLVAEVPHEVELVGSLKVEADGASIDGFYVRWTSESEWVGVEIVSGADVSITNSKIEGFSDEEIYALIINASGGGTWQYEGTVDLVSEGDVNGLYARVGDGSEILVGGAIVVTSEDDWAEGFRAEAGEDLLVTLKDVKVTAEWGAEGIYLTGQSVWEPASNTTLLVDGNVSVTTDWFAGGVTINRGDNLTATVTGDIDVSGWEWVSGVSVNSGDNASFSAGNVRVEGEDFVTGVEFNVGNYGSLALGSLEVSAFDRFALAEGLVVTGNDHLTITTNDVAVKAGSDAWGVHLTGSGWLFAGDHTTLQLDGSLQVTSTSGSAYGIDLYSGDGLSLGVTGTTVVSGAREVTAVNVTTVDDAEVTLGDVTADGGTRALGLGLVAGDSGRFAVGDVTAIGRSSRSNATGVEADLLEDASLTVGDVTVEGDSRALGVGLWAGDYGRIAVGDVTAVGRSARSNVTGVDVHLGDDVSFTIGDVTATGGASAMGALIAAGYDTSVVVDGAVTVTAMGGDADGIQVDLSPDSTMSVEGAIVVTSSDATARGVSIYGANDFSVAVNDVTVEGANAMGVYANVGGSWGMTLEVDGDVTVVGTRDSGWAEGITMIGGNELTAAVTGDVFVTGGEDVSGVWIVGEDRTTATLAGVKVAGAGEGYMVGVRFGAHDDATLTIQGDVEAIGEGDQSWVDGLWVTGYDNLTVNTKAITVAGGDRVIGVDLRGVSGFPAGDQVTLTVDGDLKATASSSGDALGMDLFTGDGLDVSVSGAIEVSGGNLAYGASIMTLNEARVAMGDVTAESDSESVGVYLVAADNGQLKLGKVTAVSQNEDATGLDLWVGDDTQINVESIAADAHGEAAGIMLQHAGTGTAINLADGFLVRSYGEHGSAVGLWLDDFDAIDVNLAGESTVRADASAIGLEIGSDAPGREAVVRNFGLIEVSGDDATGIRLSVRERAAIDNSGVIDVAGGIAVDARASTGVTVLQNEGVIMGDIYLGAGDDLFVVHSTGRIDGEVDLGDGDDGATLHAGAVVGPMDGGDGHDVLRLLGASGSVHSSTPGVQKLALEVASEVTASNFEEVVIEGGRWAFGEGSDLDNVELTGGILGGDTVLSGSLLNVSGTVAPGNSFGIVTIAGDYTQSKDALLSIEVGPTADPQPGVNHDQLIVGGTARFEPGTTIQIVPLPGIYPDRTRYVIVDGVLEDFDPDDVDLDFPMLFLNGSLEEGSLVLLVETVPFESIAESGRRQAVATALSEALGGSETELDDLYGWLHQLTLDQKPEALDAFDSISGVVYSYLPAMTARGVDSVIDATTRSIDNSPSGPRRQVWAAKYGGPGWIPQESDAPGARFVTRGLVVGGDLISRPSLRVGLVAGGGSETLTVKAADSDLRGHSSSLGAYGRYDWGEGRLTLFAGLGKTSYVSDRHVVFGADHRRAEAEFDAGSGVVWVEVGYEPVKKGKFSFEPMVSMGWLSSRQTQIKENGAGNLSLTVEPYSTQRLLGRVSLHVEMDPFEASFGTAAPRAQIAWVNDFAPRPKDQTARWQGASSTPFGIPVSRATASGLEASLGVGGSIGSKITWSFDYAAVFGNNGRSDRMQGQVGITF